MMNYPIVKTTTKDGCVNHGLFIGSENSDQVFIQIHGTSGNFYNDDFIEPLSDTLTQNGISFLSTNNRGSGVYDMYSRKGSAVEIFEECIFDIDNWIEFVLDKGYKKIYLSGHSLGVEKIIYYMEKGLHKDKVNKIVLLSPSDSPRWRNYDENYQPSEEGKVSLNTMIEEAETRIKNGQEDILMDTDVKNCFMPRTPISLLNILGEDTEIIKVLPFHTGELDMFGNIKIPTCIITGNKKEYTGISPKEAIGLMKKENPSVETRLIEDADHLFTNHESEIAKIILNFILK